nr:uncharacterized protein LOC118085516 [Zootoca vivipara]
MGSSLSVPQKRFLKDLKYLLTSNNQHASEDDLIAFIHTAYEHCPWFPEDGTWELDFWDKLGEHFHAHPSIGIRVLTTWGKIRACLALVVPKNIFLAAAPSLPSAPPACMPPPLKPSVYPALPAPIPPGPDPPNLAPPGKQQLSLSATPPPPAYVSQVLPAFQSTMPTVKQEGGNTTKLQESLKAAAPLLAFESTVIVPAGPGGGAPRHEQFELRYIKELYQSVRDNGLHSPYTLGLFGTIFQQQLLPEDIKLLARTVLKPNQVIIFMQSWTWACQRRVHDIQTNLNNAAQAAHANAVAALAAGAPPLPPPVMLTPADVLDGLTGAGNFLTTAQQLALDPQYWDATISAAQEALMSVPPVKLGKGGRWGSVQQGPTEPYGAFIDRLYNTLKRQVQDTAAQEVIIRQLAFDNANDDCKQALRPLVATPNVAIADMLKACQSIGSESHTAKLLAAKDIPETWVHQLTEDLTSAGLKIAPEKIQRTLPITYLEHKDTQQAAPPLILQLHFPAVLWLVDLQLLLGHSNWAKSYIDLPTCVLSPLYNALKGHKQPADIILDMESALATINHHLQKSMVDRLDSTGLLSLAVFATKLLPTAVLYRPAEFSQSRVCLVEWLHLPHAPLRNVYTSPAAVMDVVIKGRQCVVALIFLSSVSYSLHSLCSPSPIPFALTLFTDGTKTRGVVVWREEGAWKTRFTTEQNSAQRSELAVVILAFDLFQNVKFNLIVDIQYVSRFLTFLSVAYIILLWMMILLQLFLSLQRLLQDAVADAALKQEQVFSLFFDPLLSHATFHQSAKVLAKSFQIPISQARDIISQCFSCSKAPTMFPFDAVNPRGIAPLSIWQMDVTLTPLLASFFKTAPHGGHVFGLHLGDALKRGDSQARNTAHSALFFSHGKA